MKYSKEIMGGIAIIVDYVLTFNKLVPKWATTIIAAFLVGTYLVLLWRSNKKIGIKILSSVVSALFAVGVLYQGFHSNSADYKPLAVVPHSDLSLKFKNTGDNDQGVQSNNQINGNNNQVAVAPITVNGGNVQVGNNNTMNVKNFNLPVTRRLMKEDEARLRYIPFNYTELSVLYPPNNNEAKQYAELIIKKLHDLGHELVSTGTQDNIPMAANKRFDIVSYEKPERDITITVNPQL